MSFSVKPVFRSIGFLMGSYLDEGEGSLRPSKPKFCPYYEGSTPCRISYKDVRHRKTGPSHPLYVFGCGVHRHYFTIYPFGYTPFSRHPIWAMGLLVVNWRDLKPTYFSAAIDGSASIRWPENSDPGSRTSDFDFRGTFKTQKRHINGICSLLGIDSALSDELKQEQSIITGVPFLKMRDHEVRIRDGPNFKKKVPT